MSDMVSFLGAHEINITQNWEKKGNDLGGDVSCETFLSSIFRLKPMTSLCFSLSRFFEAFFPLFRLHFGITDITKTSRK
jgi:hypothetical protein